jgi:hypothetical protein
MSADMSEQNLPEENQIQDAEAPAVNESADTTAVAVARNV